MKLSFTRHEIHPWSVVLFLILMTGVITYHVSFDTGGVLAYKVIGASFSRGWVLAWVFRYGLSILTATALIFALAIRDSAAKNSNVAHFWLRGIVGSLLILGFIMLTSDGLKPNNAYDAIFVVTRGAFPILSGYLLSLLIVPSICRWLGQHHLELLWLPLLILPLLFNKDIFGLQNGNSIYGIVILSIIATLWLNKQFTVSLKWLGLIIIGVLATATMGILEQGGGVTLNNAGRFVGLLSPLVVLPALSLLEIGKRFKTFSRDDSWMTMPIIFSVVLSATPAYLPHIIGWGATIQSHLHIGGPIKLVAAVGCGLIVGLVVLVVSNIVVYSSLWQDMVHLDEDSVVGLLQRVVDFKASFKWLWRRYHRVVIAIGTLASVQIFSALLMNQSFKTVQYIISPNLNIFGMAIAQMFPKMIAGCIVLFAAYWVLLALTNRYWLSLITVSLSVILFAVACRVKIGLRTEPIMAADLSEITQISELLHMVNPLLIVGALIAIVAVIIVIVLVEKRVPNAGQSWPIRLTKGAVALAFLMSLGYLNHSISPTRSFLNMMQVPSSNNNPIGYAQMNGPVLQLISGFDVKAMSEPSGYSKKEIAKLVDKYKKRAAQINQSRTINADKLTVIFNLSESFADPSRIPDMTLNQDPMPYIRQLKKTTTGGYMMSFGVGGGTANMEYMTLTGMSLGAFDTTLNTPYTQLVPKLRNAPYIGTSFDYSSAIHPYTGGFYNRPTVYKKFGFNKFAYLGSKYKIIDQKKLGNSIYLSDQTAYANALKQINSRSSGQFMNLLSIQNHMPYTNWYPNTDFQVKTSNGTLSSEKNSLVTYAQGVKYTDEAVAQFKTAIDKIHKPIIWVFYGDHLPGLYTELTDELLTHKTDYFVYANKYARDHGAKLKLKGKNYVNPSDFISLALQQANAKVNPYQALLTDIQNKLPAQWIKDANSHQSSTDGVRFVNNSGKTVDYSNLSKSQKRLYKDYQMILYDINVGNQYSLKDGMQKP